MNRPALRARRGFTLLEMILSMTLMMAFLGMTAELFRKQSNAVSTQAGRLDAQQNTRFAASAIERELRMAGLGIVDAQPLLVQASATAITFNANLASLDTGDYNAVYINPDADSAAVDLLRPTGKITLPGTSTLYPDSLYTNNGAPDGTPSHAETISYWLSHDSTSAFSNEYVMYRRVNARPARVIARGIQYNGDGDSPFRYWIPAGDTAMKEITPPIIHTAAIHGSAADTGNSARTDSIRRVDLYLRSVFHDQRKALRDTTIREVRMKVRLMNAGLVHHSSCGQPPLGVAPTVVVTPVGVGVPSPYVTINWTASVDDGAGEKDVTRYAIYRHLDAVGEVFDEPIASVPAGTLTFRDNDVVSGQKWIYGVNVQDCTPALSPIGTATTVTIP